MRAPSGSFQQVTYSGLLALRHKRVHSLLRYSSSRARSSSPAATDCSSADSGQRKSALVTGANTGIGFETSKALALKGYATVLACRNLEKGRAARDQIKASVPGAKVEAVFVDLADLSTIRTFANKALDGGAPLDVLVNNAGVMACPELRTKDGFEMQLGTNHLGHFLLTTMLLPLLTDPSRPSRIVNVSSSAHSFGRMNFDDLQSRRSYQPWIAYGQSKLANILFTYELARRLPLDANVTANALHPGVVNTELQRFLLPDPIPWWQLPFLQAASVFLKSPEQGAQTSIYLATSPEVEGTSSKYWSDCKPKTSSKASYDAETARQLWEISQELTDAPPVTAKGISRAAEQPAQAV